MGLSVAHRVILVRMITHIQSEIIKLYCNIIPLNRFAVFSSGKEIACPAVSQLL